MAFTISFSRFADGGVAEVFFTNHKSGSDADINARDGASGKTATKQRRERETRKMKKFAITVERQVSQTHDFEIEAESIDEARDLAEDEISNVGPDDWDLGHVEAEEPEIRAVVELGDADESEDASEAAENEAA